MFLEITKAEYLEGYKVILHFNNGECVSHSGFILFSQRRDIYSTKGH